MYLTFDEYQTMGGTLEQTAFDEFEFYAESIINWYTFNRLLKEEEIPVAVKRCMFRLINLAEKQQQSFTLGVDNNSPNANSTIASQSNDGVSIHYNVMSASDIFEMSKKEMGKIIDLYLNMIVDSLGHRLLYRGLYPDE